MDEVDWVEGGSPQRNPEVAHVEPGAERGDLFCESTNECSTRAAASSTKKTTKKRRRKKKTQGRSSQE